MYILPPYRFTVYSMGLVLGYLLRTEKSRRLTKTELNFGWFLASVGLILTLLLTSVMSVFNYKFSSIDAAFYSSLAPIPWCFFFAWTIFSSHLGYKKSIQKHFFTPQAKLSTYVYFFLDSFVKFLDWKGFQITTKLSYGIYLVQFAVFHFNIGQVRSSSHFSILKSLVNIKKSLSFSFF